MRMFKKLRVTVSVSTAIMALAAVVAVPAGAASTTDPRLGERHQHERYSDRRGCGLNL